jgi:MFS family permease
LQTFHEYPLITELKFQDMCKQRERVTAVAFYSLAVIAGPTLGLVIGAAVSQSYLGWWWMEVGLLAFI